MTVGEPIGHGRSGQNGYLKMINEHSDMLPDGGGS